MEHDFFVGKGKTVPSPAASGQAGSIQLPYTLN